MRGKREAFQPQGTGCRQGDWEEERLTGRCDQRITRVDVSEVLNSGICSRGNTDLDSDVTPTPPPDISIATEFVPNCNPNLAPCFDSSPRVILRFSRICMGMSRIARFPLLGLDVCSKMAAEPAVLIPSTLQDAVGTTELFRLSFLRIKNIFWIMSGRPTDLPCPYSIRTPPCAHAPSMHRPSLMHSIFDSLSLCRIHGPPTSANLGAFRNIPLT